MSDKEFSILFNGHPVAVTALNDDTYMVQVTYKPVNIQLKHDSLGVERWVEVETQQETYLSAELGKLIATHLHPA
jgi:hypothetical protein